MYQTDTYFKMAPHLNMQQASVEECWFIDILARSHYIFLTLCKFHCDRITTPIWPFYHCQRERTFRKQKWGLGLSDWHQLLNTTEMLTNSLPQTIWMRNRSHLHVSISFIKRPSLAICNSIDSPDQGLTAMLRLVCSGSPNDGHYCSRAVQAAFPIQWHQQIRWIQGVT